MRTHNRYAPLTIGQSKLTIVTDANRNVIDKTSVRYFDDIKQGSKDLCAAILRTGKLHRPMTMEEQIAAVEYAHDIKLFR
jgi:hypothetical protein